MTNEIKEILDIFKQVDLEADVGGCSNCPRKKDKNRTCIGCLNNAKDKLLDYITNLQNEIFDLKDTIQNKNDCIGAYECIIEDRDKRIDKAVEYINKFESIKAYYEYEECGYTEYNYDEDFKQDLLNILRGDE